MIEIIEENENKIVLLNFKENQPKWILKVVTATVLLVCFVVSLFSKGEHLWNKEKKFYFTSKALFVFEIIKFQLFRFSNIMTSSMLKHELRNDLLNNLRIKQSDNEIWPVWYYNRKFFIKKLYEKCGLETSCMHFLIFKKSSVKKECEELYMLIWTNLNTFAITYQIFVACFKNFIFQ